MGRRDVRGARVGRPPVRRASAQVGAARNEVVNVLQGWERIDPLIEQALPKRLAVMKRRHHGDFHLGQVVVVSDDFYILDFEGEPVRTIEERWAKHSTLRDVAGLIRSFEFVVATVLLEDTLPFPGTAEELQAAVRDLQQHTLAI